MQKTRTFVLTTHSIELSFWLHILYVNGYLICNDKDTDIQNKSDKRVSLTAMRASNSEAGIRRSEGQVAKRKRASKRALTG